LIVTSLSVLGALVSRTISWYGIIMTMIWLSLAALIVYDTHCLTSGNCSTWSSIRTMIYSIIPVLAIITMLIAVFPPSQQETETVMVIQQI
jgi:hypothetical protein